MSIKILNTMSGKLEEFKPQNDKEVKMYACGITVYDESHIGHGSQAIIFDLIRRYLEYRKYKVEYVRNFTDIDDKIIKKANEQNKSALEISQYYINESINDLKNLKVNHATYEPKVSDHIKDIISFIQKLIDKNFAYVENGEVLFNTKNFDKYGKLSNRKIDDLQVQDLEADEKSNKHNPEDFTLWKPAKPEEPSWESPWGKGRPGWHIECSVLATKYLGNTLDIHGGGRDLVFPHHENEIAQSEAYSGKPFANYWIHNGLVMINGKKMSKSLGNFYTIKDVLNKYQADVIRFVVFSFTYTSNIDFSDEMFKTANKRVMYFYNTLNKIDEIINSGTIKNQENFLSETIGNIIPSFENAMDENFNTAKVIANFSDTFKKVNEFIESKDIKMKAKRNSLKLFKEEFLKVANVLNILNENPAKYIEDFKNLYLKENNIDKNQILSLIEERKTAKKDKNFKKADNIREKLVEIGISLQDTAQGTKWNVI